jgi:hypothetical protein
LPMNDFLNGRQRKWMNGGPVRRCSSGG